MEEKAIIMLGTAGIREAEKILAEKTDELSIKYSARYLKDARHLCGIWRKKQDKYTAFLGVHKDQKYIVCGTEGIFGALFRLGGEYDTGLRAVLKDIPIDQHVIELCDFVDINPYEADSTGCILLISEAPGEAIRQFSENGIEASLIGYTVNNKARVVEGDTVRYLTDPIPALQ